MGLFLKKRVEMPDKIILGNTEFVFDRKLGFHVGEWTVWDRKTKILLEFQSTEGNIGDIVLEKVNWVNDHKDTIRRKTNLPTHVSINRQVDKLRCNSVILMEQIRTIDKSRLMDRIGVLNDYEMQQVNQALGISVGLV